MTTKKTYKLQSAGFVHTPGLIAWAQNGAAFERDRKQIIDIIAATFANVPREAIAALVLKETESRIDGDSVVFSF